jgi:hypothetical protein
LNSITEDGITISNSIGAKIFFYAFALGLLACAIAATVSADAEKTSKLIGLAFFLPSVFFFICANLRRNIILNNYNYDIDVNKYCFITYSKFSMDMRNTEVFLTKDRTHSIYSVNLKNDKRKVFLTSFNSSENAEIWAQKIQDIFNKKLHKNNCITKKYPAEQA